MRRATTAALLRASLPLRMSRAKRSTWNTGPKVEHLTLTFSRGNLSGWRGENSPI